MTDHTDTARKLTIHLDPNGLWRHQRFEFCNALEAATNEHVAPQLRAAARDELERLGVSIKAEMGIATTAMHYGATAKEAVRMAVKLDIYSGGKNHVDDAENLKDTRTQWGRGRWAFTFNRGWFQTR